MPLTLADRPNRDDLRRAAGKTIPDVLVPNLRVLFCGINPGLYSAAIDHHFGRPGNRFWLAINAAGFTPRLYSPYEDQNLPALGYGITNLVGRATANASELTEEELRRGAGQLNTKVEHYKPQIVAVLGISAYRRGFGRPKAIMGRQPENLAGAVLWVLPNPSGLNAHFQLADLAREYKKLLE